MEWQTIIPVFLSSVVESLCSLFFVLIGCGSTFNWPGEETNPNVLSISLCFGFSCASLVNISTYFSAITGAGLLCIIVPQKSSALLGVTQIQTSPWVGFGVELLMTLAVTLTVLMCTDGGHTTVAHAASVLIAQVVAACHLFAYPVTGCGINPARVFGPALVAQKWTDHWVYWFGPIFGALLTTGIYHMANNFPVASVDELFITGRELKNSKELDKKDDNQGQPLRGCDIQTDSL